ncbi:MAG TPA: glycosyltransferase family 39 protein [Gemmatimonadales bacterium]|nr:glycosyltransferase family 39 protein [Gemmatimonadales bacterium]
MTLALTLSALASATTGVLLLTLAWPRTTGAYPRALATVLGAGFGAGLSAVLLFAWLQAFGPTRGILAAEAALLGLVTAIVFRRRRVEPRYDGAGDGARRSSGGLVLLSAAFLVALAAAAAAFFTMLRQHPHGEWDAWMNWDLRARMIFRGGEGWRTAFSPAIPWSHPDYPVLVPSLVVRNWLYVGTDTLRGPALVAATFTFGTVALVVAALAALRRPSQGLLAGLVLLGTPFFIVHGTSLYADVPLGFFFLATFVCLALDARHGGETSRFATLAGVAAGLSMWTKNEGLPFTLAVAAGLLVAGAREGWMPSLRRLRAFAAGLLPLLVLVASFKLAYAPPNDLLSTLGVDRTIGRLTAPDRYATTLREYRRHLLGFGHNGVLGAAWAVAGCVLLLGINRREAARTWARAALMAIVLLLAIHFMVFVSMADELLRLLNSSLERLLLQLWPSVVFLCFMAARTIEEVLIRGPVGPDAPTERSRIEVAA